MSNPTTHDYKITIECCAMLASEGMRYLAEIEELEGTKYYPKGIIDDLKQTLNAIVHETKRINY